jgi:hypothetical protein
MTHMRRTTNALVNYIGRNVPLEVAIPLFIQRLESRTVSNERGCKYYTGSTNSDGYGKVSFQGRSVLIHRWIFEQHHGPIPRGILICHECDTPQCWNIDHLFAGTSQDNLQDCAKKGRHTNGAKTHCPRGHEYNDQNMRYTDAGKGRKRRACIVCQRARLRIKAGLLHAAAATWISTDQCQLGCESVK